MNWESTMDFLGDAPDDSEEESEETE